MSLTRLNLFEGIVIGIYGNWLISFIDKMTFTKPLIVGNMALWWYQPFCVAASFVCLLTLIGIGVLKERFITRGLVVLLAFAHISANWAAFVTEGLPVSTLFFLGIGIFLFMLIYSSEVIRLRENNRRKTLRNKAKEKLKNKTETQETEDG